MFAMAMAAALCTGGGLIGCSEPNQPKEDPAPVSEEQSEAPETEAQAAPEPESEAAPEAEPEPEPIEVVESKYVTIDGVFVNNGYANKESDSLKRVYVFYTVNTADKNFDVTSSNLTLTVDGLNEYEASSSLGGFKGTYENTGNVVKNVYVGDSVRLLSIFDIPQGDLEPGKTITFDSFMIDDLDGLAVFTDSIVFADSLEEISQTIDPEGYEEEQWLREPADAETVSAVMNYLPYYEYYASGRGMSWTANFYESGEFEIEMSVSGAPISNTGTYTICNGYIALYYPSNDHTTYLPWEWNDSGTNVSIDIYEGMMGGEE